MNTNRTGFYILLAATIGLMGCAASKLVTEGGTTRKPVPDPLVGWHVSGLINLNSNKAVTDDYKDYIQKLRPEERKAVAYIEYFEDGTGRHAVKITIGLNGTNWRHVLIYNKDNERIKTIKYVSGHSAS